MPEIQPADPRYQRDLGDGLRLRWSTAADAAALGALFGYVFRNEQDGPFNHCMDAFITDLLTTHPYCGPDSFALVEDAEGRAVAATGLMTLPIRYADVPLVIGRPEIVATLPEYRNRGLISQIFALIHARSAALGHLIQVIGGIGHFYRQFGYDYAIDLSGGREVPFDRIPLLKDGESEPFTLRAATAEDAPLLARLFGHSTSYLSVASRTDEDYWRWVTSGIRPETGEGFLTQIVLDASGAAAGYAMPRRLRWSESAPIAGIGFAPGVSAAAALPAVLRGLRRVAEQTGGWPRKEPVKPASALYFQLGNTHPIYPLLGEKLVGRIEPAYALYVRVPDLIALLNTIAPVLERRLAASPLANYSGELTLDLYKRDNLKLLFDAGAISAAPWNPSGWDRKADASIAALLLPKLIFGHRSLTELRRAYPDFSTNDRSRALLEALFPAGPNDLLLLD